MADMKELIRQLYDARQEYWLTKFGRHPQEGLGAPAGQSDIDAEAKLLIGGLPPSYSEFLSIHRRWPNFVGDAGILAPEDRKNELIRQQIEGFRNLAQSDAGGAAGSFYVIVAGESSPYLAYFDTKSRRPDGEMEIVEWSYESGEMLRHPDFHAYLRSRLDVYRRLITKEKSKS